MNALGSILALGWEFFALPVPVLGISFAALYVGVFVVSLSISLLVPLLGVGRGAVNSVSRAHEKRARARSSALRDKGG